MNDKKEVKHSHSHTHSHNYDSEKNIGFAFWMNISFAIIEVIGGLITNSVAILSDAVHDFGDSISLGLAWYFQRLSKKGSDEKYSYGYKRFSLLGAIINSVVLLVGSILILSETIPRIINPQETNIKGMFILSIFGVIVNGAAILRLRKGNTLNERVVSLHMMEDVLGWLAIFIGTIIMYFFDAPIIDPIMSVLISFYILFNVFKNIKLSMRVILQGTPVDIDIDEIKKAITEMENVESVHDFHSWSVDGNYNIATTHVVLKQNIPMDETSILKETIRDKLKQLNIQHVTIELETIGEECIFEECI
ncbi:MAG: cation transporter [Bacteroidales bacterium 36-12]|nr:MAG: cation transporter [Bacteroidales bacterium 36-12]